jgi:transposase
MMPLDFKQIYPTGTYERFLVDTINQLDLSRFTADSPDTGGEMPYDPRALLSVIFYGFSTGTYSSRRLSAACASKVP